VLLPDGTVIEYLVDGADRRIARKVNGLVMQQWLYLDRLRLVAELDSAGNVVSTFGFASGGNSPAYMTRSGMTYRIIEDHLGSPRLVVDAATGAVAQRMDFDEFGNVLLDTNPGFQPFGFAGGLYDPQTRLVRFGARDYDAETGRWCAKDPIRFAGGQESLYAYVDNDPVNKSDPAGLGFWAKVGQYLQNPLQALRDAWQAIKDLATEIWNRSQEVGRRVLESAKDLWDKARDLFGRGPATDVCIQYEQKVLDKAAADPFHNFPWSFDQHILQNGYDFLTRSGYQMWVMPGSANGYEGVYELGGKVIDGVFNLSHRVFVPFK